MELREIREKLDQIDDEILKLFEQRMQLCIEVGRCKIKTGKKIYDREREEEKLKILSEKASGDFNKKAVQELFEHIMKLSRELQHETFKELEQ